MATNRPDTLDPALLRPGRLDRKVEIPLPNEMQRLEILKIHAQGIAKHGDIDYEAVIKLADGFNGADLRNVCTEAGKYACPCNCTIPPTVIIGPCTFSHAYFSARNIILCYFIY